MMLTKIRQEATDAVSRLAPTRWHKVLAVSLAGFCIVTGYIMAYVDPMIRLVEPSNPNAILAVIAITGVIFLALAAESVRKLYQIGWI